MNNSSRIRTNNGGQRGAELVLFHDFPQGTGAYVGMVSFTRQTLSGVTQLETFTGRIACQTTATGAVLQFEGSSGGSIGPSGVPGVVLAQLAEGPGNDETALLLRVDRAGTESVSRVSIGAADSGGAGFRLLRVPN